MSNRRTDIAYSISLGVLPMLIILSTIGQTTIAYAATLIHFHISNIMFGEDVRFVITNTDTGHRQYFRTHIAPFLSDTVTIRSSGGLPVGADTEGCMTNFANRYTSCDQNVVEPDGLDFNVSAR